MSLRTSYVIGFFLSIALTLLAYFTVVEDLFGENNFGVIMVLALAQFVVQVVFFLHMGKTSKPSWSDIALYFMMLIVVTIVVGSMWIMSNLDYHHATETEGQNVEEYILEEEGFKIKNEPTSHDTHDSQPHDH